MADHGVGRVLAHRGHWIGGEVAAPSSGAYFFTSNPADDSPISKIARGNAEDVDRAVSAADQAAKSTRLSVRERESILGKSAELLERDCDAFVELLIEEIGSPIGKARFEIQMAVDALRAAAGAARRAGGQTFPSDASDRFSLSLRQPAGVVASITPFNVPLLIGVKASSMAIATGNAVVALPSEDAPLISLRLAELYAEAGLPAGLFNVVTGSGAEIGDSLTQDRRVRAVLFTGSSAVGKHIGALCGAQLKPAILELGGKSPLVVLEDADLDQAVAGAVFGIFLYQGQVCMGSSRVFVEDGLYDRFASAFAAAARTLPCGNLRDPDTLVGPIINPRQRARVRSHIESAVAKGARVLAGGGWDGNVCQPTVLEGVDADMPVFDEETFGPVAQLYRVGSLDEAIALANASRYGLSAAIYTRDIAQALRFAHEVRSGMVHINAPSVHDEPHVPFGGVGDSGMGRTGTEESLAALTQMKWVTAQM
jgi:acyl-CoA reductase-like NAD-dependent aldehyde dehydrogenase